MRLGPWTPGEIVSFDQATTRARVKFSGLSDDAEEFPEAMVCYPVGDKSVHTAIRILPGDLVWLDFVNGDERFPIIQGFRTREAGNAVDVRRWHHANMELQADTDLRLFAGAQVLVQAGTEVRVLSDGSVLIQGATSVSVRAPQITLDGETTVTGQLTYMAGIVGNGPATSNGKDVSDTHYHKGVSTGGDLSGQVGP